MGTISVGVSGLRIYLQKPTLNPTLTLTLILTLLINNPNTDPGDPNHRFHASEDRSISNKVIDCKSESGDYITIMPHFQDEHTTQIFAKMFSQLGECSPIWEKISQVERAPLLLVLRKPSCRNVCGTMFWPRPVFHIIGFLHHQLINETDDAVPLGLTVYTVAWIDTFEVKIPSYWKFFSRAY